MVFEPEEFKRLGIPYVEEEKHTNHFDAGSAENILRVRKLIK